MTAAASMREAWLAARLDLLKREKALTRERDAIAAARRAHCTGSIAAAPPNRPRSHTCLVARR